MPAMYLEKANQLLKERQIASLAIEEEVSSWAGPRDPVH